MNNGMITALLNDVKDKNHGAFTELYAATYSRVFIACQRILSGGTLTEDAVQETFLKVWRHAAKFDPSLSCGGTWIETVAKNTALDMLRRQRSHPATQQDATDVVLHEGPARSLETEQQRSAIERGMAGLDTQERASLRLAFYHEYSHTQLAEQMDRPLGTVKSWIRRGMKQLRLELRGMDGNP